ncbi:hypothetical protein OD218_001774 [Salmonella enterica]|nr:hypothetical protein [Salmonella enterica]EJB9183708.1 hypothetical protein [Salmonella enterica]EJC0848848.1 hypothetical protein [Salmonella enterica]EJX3080118.1 hypothetical protein [Salmonella enterica]EJX3098349.1 hypothetical protein [Salmonella enterica]
MNESYRQFEDWWSKEKSQFTDDDELKNFSWVIWQASRAAIEIELPDPNDDSLLSTWQYRDATHNVLDGAGIKVKE